LAWLLNGPSANSARSMLRPSLSPALASLRGRHRLLCGAMCGGTPRVTVPEELSTEYSAYVTQSLLEACLSQRAWRALPRVIAESMHAGDSAWCLTAASLRRVVQDSFADAAASRGGMPLPLLSTVGEGAMVPTACSACKVEVQLLDGGLFGGPIFVGPLPRQATLDCSRLGIVRATEGLLAWLLMCRPVALWISAFAARDKRQRGGETLSMGRQIAKAMQTAMSTTLTESMIHDVWNALIEADTASHLHRRANGSWTMLPWDTPNLLL